MLGGLLRGAGLVTTVTMAVAEVCESEVRVVKHAVETGKASVESATAGAGVVWGVGVNMVDFRCECEDGLVRSCCGCFETLMLKDGGMGATSLPITLRWRHVTLCWFQ